MLAAALLALAGCAPTAVGPAPAHLTQAQLWHSPSTDWAPPDALAQAGDGVLDAATAWHTVALPHTQPRAVASTLADAQAAPEVSWFRLQVPAAALAATPQGPRLYLPRWQTLGTLAVYGNGRLLWQSRGDGRVWNSFNRPVWIDLGGVAPPGQPLALHLRMASQRDAGGALSTLWAGPAEALKLSWRARTLAQADLVAFSRGSYLVIGVFALGVWLLRRRRDERLYLLFFLMSVFQLLSTLHYLVDNEGFGITDDWFTWLTYVLGALGANLCAFFFLCAINRLRLPRLAWAMVLYALVLTLATLPGLGLPLGTALPLARMALAPPALVVIGIGVWGALRTRSWSSALLAGWLLLSLPIGIHDLRLQSYQGDLEDIYYTPYVYVGLFAMFLLIAYTRYVRALDVAAQAQATLARRLAERERELAASHARLRQVEREQTLMAERQRLMREMHDGVGSSLMSALRWVEQGRPGEVDVAQVLRESIDDLKISIDSLEPVDADLLALLAGLRFRLAPRLEGAGLVLHWQVQEVPPLPWLDAQNALHVLRIVQEVLANIVKHSGARAITLRTAPAERDGAPGVQVQVQDDGRPFAPPPPGTRQPGRKGLGNVQARARALGAHVGWAPQPGGGTVFTLWLPLQGPGERADDSGFLITRPPPDAGQ